MAILTVITANGKVELPAPTTISIGSELIWSSNTGRISTGKMIGDAIAEKETLSITWEFLMAAEYKVIKDSLIGGFWPLIINVDGEEYQIDAYRGTLTRVPLGQLDDDNYYYRSANVDIVEQ